MVDFYQPGADLVEMSRWRCRVCGQGPDHVPLGDYVVRDRWYYSEGAWYHEGHGRALRRERDEFFDE